MCFILIKYIFILFFKHLVFQVNYIYFSFIFSIHYMHVVILKYVRSYWNIFTPQPKLLMIKVNYDHHDVLKWLTINYYIYIKYYYNFDIFNGENDIFFHFSSLVGLWAPFVERLHIYLYARDCHLQANLPLCLVSWDSLSTHEFGFAS